MGEVYLVQHPRLPRQEALKVLRADISSDSSFRERFIREADLAAALRHPHVIGIHDRGEHDGQLWISMDYIDGTDLGRVVEERYPSGMPVGLVLPVVAAVASALDYAHKKGLLHRDVKPANVMVADIDTDDPQVFLADFGIARPLDDSAGITSTNMTVGTVAYAAPEQLTGEQIDGRADQYALGATSYHLLTGTHLFPHTNPAVVIGRHLSGAPPTLSDSRPELADLDASLRTALAKSPEARYPSCTAFAYSLAQAMEPRRLEASAGTVVAPVKNPSPANETAPPSATAHEKRPGGPVGPQPAGAHSARVDPKSSSLRTRGLVRASVLVTLLIAACIFAVMAYARADRHAEAAPQWTPYVEAGKQVASDLTTLNYATIDADVQRILDISTGQFHRDFAQNAVPFKQSARDAHTVTAGTVTGAGLEDLDDNKGTVLVAITVKTATVEKPEQEPKAWRMRVRIVNTDGGYKAEAVEFVP